MDILQPVLAVKPTSNYYPRRTTTHFRDMGEVSHLLKATFHNKCLDWTIWVKTSSFSNNYHRFSSIFQPWPNSTDFSGSIKIIQIFIHFSFGKFLCGDRSAQLGLRTRTSQNVSKIEMLPQVSEHSIPITVNIVWSSLFTKRTTAHRSFTRKENRLAPSKIEKIQGLESTKDIWKWPR